MISFRVYPGRKNWMASETERYWQVRVYPTKRSFLRFWKNNAGTGLTNFSAIVMPRSVETLRNKVWTVSPFLGYVLFRKGHMGGDIVAHEAVHMGMEYLRRHGHSLQFSSQIDEREEFLAYAIGNCVRQITAEFWERKLWTSELAD